MKMLLETVKNKWRLRPFKTITPYQLRSFLVFLLLGSLGFLVVQLQNEDLISSNYGIDCEELQRLVKAGLHTEARDKYRDLVVELIAYGMEESFVIKKRPLLNCLEADDPYLAHVIARDMLHPPAPKSKHYAVKDDQNLDFTKHHQAKDVIDMVFKNAKKNGFFVEAGAADCEFSETLPLERLYNWTGVLIEAVPRFFKECTEVNRKAYLLNNCLGTEARPHFAKFNLHSTGVVNNISSTSMGGFDTGYEGANNTATLQCLPLQSILAALDNPTVNLFVLDIEGFELAVLRAINWDKVDIEVLSVEVDLAGLFQKDSSVEIIRDFMKSKGYTRFAHRDDMNMLTGKAQNDLYVRNDIVKKYNVVQL